MSDLNQNNNFSRYFKVINPSEIHINKEDIFYREKYKEIINYLKLILTDSKDLEIFNYFNPKGLLFIQTNPGIDLLDYLKLICSNFYIYYIQLRDSIINEDPTGFFNNFPTILNKIDETLKSETKIQTKTVKDQQDKNLDYDVEKLIIINQNERLTQNLENQNLLNKFLSHYQEEENLKVLLENKLIIIWINYDNNGVLDHSEQLYNIFDYVIRVPILNKTERQQVFREFMENNPKISFDINQLVELTENWEVKEIDNLLRLAILKHHFNSELNTTSNEITDSIIDLIETGEFIPYFKKRELKHKEDKEEISYKEVGGKTKIPNQVIETKINDGTEDIISQIKSEKYSDFMLNQLYENAASENYNELILIIDKLDKKEPLEENDRKILSKFPFILSSSPSKAQILLEKAKKRIDMITKSFGK
ncbi:MAG: hypothetical protein EU543_00985 [Promethearchaeota archaeon]|nr:MAG: hypothetical protein EU543_00985 [Candidatus Lokiarchaeota archaeon]